MPSIHRDGSIREVDVAAQVAERRYREQGMPQGSVWEDMHGDGKSGGERKRASADGADCGAIGQGN